MPLARFTRLFEKIRASVKVINLHNWGEPFQNPDLLAIVGQIAEAGIRSHADSNFNFPALDGEAARRLLGSGLTSLYASIDGTSQECYQTYRVGGDFALAWHNLETLAAARRDLGTGPELVWKFLIHKHTEAQIPTALEMADQIGVPIHFQLLSTDGDRAWHSTLHDRADQLQPGEPLLVRWRGADHPVVWQNYRPTSMMLRREQTGREGSAAGAGPNATQPDDLDLPLSVGQLRLDPRFPWCCLHPFTSLYVNSDGAVTPCCTAYGDSMTVGNLLEQSLEEVWNGPGMIRCRQFLLQGDRLRPTGSVCASRHCQFLSMALGDP